MTELINRLTPIENEGKRILLTSQLAELYGTENQIITNNFNRNKERYIEGKDYYLLEGDIKRNFLNQTQIDLGSKNAKTLYLWTEHGALLHAKSLGTNKAWEIYGELVDTYFKVQEQKKFSPMSQAEFLLAQAQLIVGIEKDVTTLKGTIDILEDIVENQITLDCGKQRTLQNIVSKRAYERVGQAFPKDIKQNVGRFFNAIYKDLKNRFGVASYRDININDYANAIQYVGAWIEPAEVRNEVS